MRSFRTLTFAVLSFLVVAGFGTRRSRADDGGGKPAAKTFVIADDGSVVKDASVKGSTLVSFDTGDPSHGAALRWSSDGKSAATLGIPHVPADLRPYRVLLMRVRAPARPAQEVDVYLSSANGGVIGALPAIGPKWKDVRILLPNLTVEEKFDPTSVDWFQLVTFQPGPFTLELDDIRLVKAKGGWRFTPEELKRRKNAPVLKLADFENPGAAPVFRAEKSEASVVADPTSKSHVLKWVQTKSSDGGWLSFTDTPADVTGYRHVRFRARMVAGNTSQVYIRFTSDKGVLEGTMPKLGSKWQTLDFLLPEMDLREKFDPTKALCFRFVCFETAGFTMEIDDVELLRGGAGWRYSGEERRELGIDTTAPEYRIANFERVNCLRRVLVQGGKVSRVPGEKNGRNKGHVLRWDLKKKMSQAGIAFVQVPGDIRQYRSLRFRARAERPTRQPNENEVFVSFQDPKGDFGKYVEGIGRRWKEFDVELPDMTARNGFDPKDVKWFNVVVFDVQPNVYEFDDFELVKGAGGWKRSAKEQLVHVFGDERVRKVRTIKTKHFLVSTDSVAAERRFPFALEKMYDFVCEKLGIEGIKGKLPVYIFQNSNLYFDFCTRQGWSKAEAEETAGHAGPGYFATFYQSPEAPTVVHELTHAIFHKAMGDGGGSWFQEGVAVYVENLWQKRSVAKRFSSRARSGDFVPLSEFVEIPELATSVDKTGGARTAGALYEQAGAFFEYLRRGPPAESTPGAIAALAVLDTSAPSYVKDVERILGGTLFEVQARWLAWAKHPPKLRR